jgi:hypothetical protein
MLSPKALLTEFVRVSIVAANAPPPEDLSELCAIWIEVIGDEVDDAALRPAFTAHLKESGFWPRPNDILRHGRLVMQEVRWALEKQIEDAKPSRIFEMEPDPPGLLPGEYVERWSRFDYEEGRCDAEKRGRIKKIWPKSSLWAVRS